MRIFYINLERRKDRNELFLTRNAGIAEFHRVDAVDGRRLRVEDLVREGVVHAPLAYTAGALGNALSHKDLWARCIADAAVMTIAEDDAVLNRRFADKAANVLARLPPDWDLIQWGWNFDSILHVEILDGLTQAAMAFDPQALGSRAAEFQEKDWEVLPLRLLGAFGIVCYSISPTGARRLSDLCFPLKNEEVSIPGLRRIVPNSFLGVILNKHFRSMRAYVSFPPLAWTENDHRTSDVVPRA